MKLYNKIGAFALALGVMTSCAVNDPFGNNLELGQVLPTVSWELGSSVCKAGGELAFKGKYYTTSGKQIDRSEVWASVTRSESAAASCKLTTKLAYTKIVTGIDTVRSSQFVKAYPHSEEYWNGHEYQLNTTFPTSQTLSPLSWANPKQWGEPEQTKFELYYPKAFQAEFVETVIEYLTKDSTYYDDLRHVYVNFDFKAEQFQALNSKYNVDFPTEIETGKKSDLWYTKPTVVVGYYYIVIDANGKAIIHEVAKKEDAPDGVKLYNVYESSKWVFCRYSDDTGGTMTSVRASYMPYLKDLISLIKFQEWIYNGSEQSYTVSFSRTYKLKPEFKVFEKDGKMGTDTEVKEVELN